MAIINLRDIYYWYTQDEFVEVTDEMAAELLAGKNADKAHARRMRRNKVYSLDAGDGVESSAFACSTYDPVVIFELREGYCRLCCTLNSLPEIQGRRIEAHYLLGKSQAEIAKSEGVTKGSVSISITRALTEMKTFYEHFDFQSNFCPQSDLIYEG